MGYEVIHEQTYDYVLFNTLSVSGQQAEEAIGAISYALNKNPKGFPIVKNPDIYLAKMLARPNDSLPEFRVWFRLNEGAKIVYLLYIDHG